MKMTESPVLNKVLDDNAYVGIPLSHESTTSDSSPSLLVPKSNNSTTVSLGKLFVLYVRHGGLTTFVSELVLGATESIINLGFTIDFGTSSLCQALLHLSTLNFLTQTTTV